MVYVELSADTEQQLLVKIQEYLKDYPTAGYGTLAGKVIDYNDKYTCVVSRNNSSD